MRGLLTLATGFFALFAHAIAFPQPEKIYGVNLGSWLLLEPWMLPDEWVSMGGQICANCQDCIASEFALTQANPNTADQIFDKHWRTWFTEADVQRLKELGINTVRIPLGYWLVEPLVEPGEYYPKGGMRRLKEGLGWLKEAGIAAILDHHALPGVSADSQMFAGRCTSDVQFYTPKNYHRALIWTAVMTFFSHVDPDFESVFSIEAINEPLMDASKTPGFGQFQKDFVQTVRAVEAILGISSQPGSGYPPDYSSSGNLTVTMQQAAEIGQYSDEVKSVLRDSGPVLFQMLLKYSGPESISGFSRPENDPLIANFMDMTWQYNNPPNPADAKNGPQTYDDHLYYSFGGVADPNPTAYLTSMCNLERIQRAANVQNSPLWFGEWAISVNFNATTDFMKQWADAQKLQYSKSAGWIFWSFKIEDSPSVNGLQYQWSYYKGIEVGYLTEDPSAYHDPNVCKNYTKPA
ncbi:glycoside hydrolase family 5 protein [Thelephora terrestris]|uniref:Glycoside hydrolase family 5 protein n=1 Tax=Thelephora terrestris TaxID=56493 RepID=A0A9P6L1I5_9AGAM|nr:glycoside hydrolase family 5 protein [Thelephora terrestris]